MKKRIRPGISAIIFTKVNGKKRYLLLKRKMYWTGWEWLKGGKRDMEKEIQTLRREIKEETGKNPSEYTAKRTKSILTFMYQRPFVHDFKLWDGGKNRVYLVEFNNPKIRLDSDEHSSYKWLSKKETLKRITFSDQAKIFKKLA
jgi:8-oxo-dGTP pyrophosphatase MutT (NUDIX family)